MEKITTTVSSEKSLCEKSSISTTTTTAVSLSPCPSIRPTDNHSLFPKLSTSNQNAASQPKISDSESTKCTPMEADLEAQNLTTPKDQNFDCRTRSLFNKTKSDPMWPDRQDLKLRRMELKRERACCVCWAGMNRKQRGIISTIVIIVILGAGLSVGFGISKRVGGGVVNSQGTNSPVLRR